MDGFLSERLDVSWEQDKGAFLFPLHTAEPLAGLEGGKHAALDSSAHASAGQPWDPSAGAWQGREGELALQVVCGDWASRCLDGLGLLAPPLFPAFVVLRCVC